MAEADLMHVRARVGMMFHENALFDSLTVGENVGYRLDPITATSVDDEIIKLRDLEHVTCLVATHHIRARVLHRFSPGAHDQWLARNSDCAEP
jgi:ABC-type transporter Mla maintaining outer membrane lipid asymmetry ATPase subunit MlaF